jgi:sodium/potassium-transporting ATPase subunit alpha
MMALRLDKAGWDYIFMHKELVFSRTTPEQKLQIVSEAQLRGDRVGVTGLCALQPFMSSTAV